MPIIGWRHYGDPAVVPLCRSRNGSIGAVGDIIGIGGGGLGIAIAGMAATRHLLAERPLAVLRGE